MRYKHLIDHTGVTYTNMLVNNDGTEMVLDPHMPDKVVKTILDKNAEDRADGVNLRAHGTHAARIPVLWREQWRKEWKKGYADKFTWTTYLIMQLNKSENKLLLTGVKKL